MENSTCKKNIFELGANMKIIIWGTGEICEEFRKYISSTTRIVGYIDSYKFGYLYKNVMVHSPQEIFADNTVNYDFVVIASVYSNDIFKICLELNANFSKIIFLRPLQSSYEIENYLRNIECLRGIAQDYIPIANRENGIQMGIDSIKPPELDCYPLYRWDYYRYRTFELIADEIEEVKGDVAEVGVFKGYFSKLINLKFPNNKLYLFDTFEGFDDNEAETEKKAGHCDENFIEIFRNTSVDQVMDLMPYKENCYVKKGFFPNSAVGIDTSFKFVSIDLDFEESIYNALAWFYPRLVSGGFIFIHDYNETTLLGVRKAVQRYEEEGGKLIKVPIADKSGTLIITKR